MRVPDTMVTYTNDNTLKEVCSCRMHGAGSFLGKTRAQSDYLYKLRKGYRR